MFLLVKKYLKLPSKKRCLLKKVLLFTILVRISLKIYSIKKIIKWAEQQVSTTRKYNQEDIVWAIKAIDKRCSFATCLVNGLVAQYLFSKNLISSQLHVGVKKSESGKLQAHAWVTLDHRVVIGALSNLDSYTLLFLTRSNV